MSLNEIVKLKRRMTLKEAIKKSKYAKDIVQEMDKLKVDAKIMRSLFAESIDKAVTHVRKLLHTYSQVSHILLAGGFSESQLFQDAMQHSFPGKTLIVPSDAGLAVLKGAVIHGHNTTMISSRKAKFAYGVGFYAKYDPTLHTPGRHIKIGKHKGYVAGCFDTLIEMDKDLQQDSISAIKCYEPFPGDLNVIVELFCCDNNSPTYVDEPGCFKLGKVTVDCPARDDLVTVSLFLGGTELKVSAVNSVGKAVSATFDLPD
ncbi:hypothetical protein DPMN_124987 [Dreissena polymorpha]|uniref:Uncharacterized protein n=1 Tax=Dreissena polymorpha TaxID=45954 RepID=A0A9D4JWQ3_DREPO|nr:hypothetical protein DPMN_124987 [Dreissena polymorpha]